MRQSTRPDLDSVAPSPRLRVFVVVLALVLATAVALATIATTPAVAADRQSPERLWEAFPLDPSGAGDDGITLEAPEPLTSSPPQSIDEPPDDDAAALPPAARTGADEGGDGGIGTAVLLAIAAAALLIAATGAIALRILRTPKDIGEAPDPPRPPEPQPRHGSPYPQAAALDAEPAPIAATVVTAPPKSRLAEEPPRPWPDPEQNTPPPTPRPAPTAPISEPRRPTPATEQGRAGPTGEPGRHAPPVEVKRSGVPAEPQPTVKSAGPVRVVRDPNPQAPEPIPVQSDAAASAFEMNRLYGPAVCLEFASGLSDEVLDRAIVLFSLLDREGAVGSAVAARALGVKPQELPGLIITPLRRRADALKLPVAYVAERDETTGRRRWRDREGVAGRLREAAITIRTARSVTGAGGGGAGATAKSAPSRSLT